MPNKIDALRRKKGMSYGLIATKTKLSPTYIHFLAKGKRTNPSLAVMQKISQALGEKVEKVFQINL